MNNKRKIDRYIVAATFFVLSGVDVAHAQTFTELVPQNQEEFGDSNGSDVFYFKWAKDANVQLVLENGTCDDYDFLAKADPDLNDRVFIRDYNSINEIGNSFVSLTSGGSGAAMFLSDDEFTKVTGDFVNNHLTNTQSDNAAGGAMYAHTYDIDHINGNFIGNRLDATKDNTYCRGGAINTGSSGIFSEINGNFIGNSVSAQKGANGGAIEVGSGSIIGPINGDFIGNSAHSFTNAIGGAIAIEYGNRVHDCYIENITGNFIGNHTSSETSASGGAIYNYGESAAIGLLALDKDVIFTGNYITSDKGVTKTFEAISNSDTAVIQMNAYEDKKVVINDRINSSDGKGTINVNNGLSAAEDRYNEFIANPNTTGLNFGVVEFNNSVSNQIITVNAGTLKLGSYEGETIELTPDYKIETENAIASLINSELTVLDNATLRISAPGVELINTDLKLNNDSTIAFDKNAFIKIDSNSDILFEIGASFYIDFAENSPTEDDPYELFVFENEEQANKFWNDLNKGVGQSEYVATSDARSVLKHGTDWDFGVNGTSLVAIPEPATISLIGLISGSMLLIRRRLG